jgi:hypothetical protein
MLEVVASDDVDVSTCLLSCQSKKFAEAEYPCIPPLTRHATQTPSSVAKVPITARSICTTLSLFMLLSGV